MLQNIQRLPRGQRLVIFVLLMGGALMGLVAITGLLILFTLNSAESTPVGLGEGVSVEDFAILPDDDAYPAAVAVGDGVVYTGSYVSGALWAARADGTLIEIAGTRAAIGAVAGLAVAPDGALYIVDQMDADPRTFGGSLWRLGPDGALVQLAGIDDERGFVLPDDVAVDAAGRVYVSDRGRGEVWRFDPDGGGAVAWWTPSPLTADQRPAPTGLAYDPVHGALVITDSNTDTLYRVRLADGATETLYTHGDRPNPPGFDGVTVAPDGTLYVAALGQQGVARLEGDELVYVAGLFRGPSDVIYAEGRLFVTNFDSFSLVISAVQPRLPFTISMVTLAVE